MNLECSVCQWSSKHTLKPNRARHGHVPWGGRRSLLCQVLDQPEPPSAPALGQQLQKILPTPMSHPFPIPQVQRQVQDRHSSPQWWPGIDTNAMFFPRSSSVSCICFSVKETVFNSCFCNKVDRLSSFSWMWISLDHTPSDVKKVLRIKLP